MLLSFSKEKMAEHRIVNTVFLKNMSLYNSKGQISYVASKLDFKEGSKEIYKWLGVSYPKFYKMDSLSKAAFLTAELLLKDQNWLVEPDKRGLFIANSSSSLDTDEKYHHKTFANKEIIPNPALFVYTLPNIMIGELSIRHQFKGEQCLWVSEDFDANYITNYINYLLGSGEVDTCLVGWVDFYHGKEIAFISLIENENIENRLLPEFNPENMLKKYHQLINL